MSERILVGTAATISNVWYEDGVAVDPGTVTVGINRQNGTVLVAAGAATAGSGVAARTFNLTTTHTALLDRFVVTWTSPSKGALTTYVEVVGGYFYSLVEGVAAGMTVGEVPAKRTNAEMALEDQCHVAFVPRYAYEIVHWTETLPRYVLPLRWPLIRTVRSITLNGVAVTGQIDIHKNGLYRLQGWTWSTFPYVVEYEHGYDYPPADAGRVAIGVSKRSTIDPTAGGQLIQKQAGQEMQQFAPPTTAGHFGSLELDAFVQAYRFPLVA